MSVTKQGKGYVARYTEVDASTMTTEIYPARAPAANTWATSYILKKYTNAPARPSPGQDRHLHDPKARRIRELTRYDGKKWILLAE